MGKNNQKQAQSNKTSITIIGLVLLGIIVLMSSLIFLQEKSKGDTSKDLENMYSELSTIGEKSSPVHIVEFGDYKCPFCKEFNASVVPTIIENYVDTGKAQFHFINYSFLGTDSPYIAQFTETVRQELGEEEFWTFHDAVYANQGDESTVWGTEEFLTDILKDVVSNEEDVQKVVKAVQENKYQKNIEEQNQLTNKLQVKGTPTIMVNGKEMVLTSPEAFFQELDKAVAENK
ncbi:thiol-disulfide oxidoreductase [Bacillus sp. M6-12]|uniref:DsbA family protein n=1 Tax=Bacillus sp. M6-12 TaxID=2054166 RepID=UPI000C78D40D|nr:DsbA family protein [Bacillus sp. M6-12]PLS19235.1 thiol-disulfide oxidoreductase [Bacillus sp. M6-12]